MSGSILYDGTILDALALQSKLERSLILLIEFTNLETSTGNIQSKILIRRQIGWKNKRCINDSSKQKVSK